MARVKQNSLISGLSGRMGMLVFRQIGKNTFVSPAPRKPDKRDETIAQRQTRTTFRDASRWAKLELLDPEKKKRYQQQAKKWGLPNAYTAAIKEYMNGGKKRELVAPSRKVVDDSVWALSQSSGKPDARCGMLLRPPKSRDEGNVIRSRFTDHSSRKIPEENGVVCSSTVFLGKENSGIEGISLCASAPLRFNMHLKICHAERSPLTDHSSRKIPEENGVVCSSTFFGKRGFRH